MVNYCNQELRFLGLAKYIKQNVDPFRRAMLTRKIGGSDNPTFHVKKTRRNSR